MKRFERSFQRFINRNWLYILIGLWLTAKAMDSAYKFRGYRAAGSELFVLPVFLIAVEMLRKAIRCIAEARRER